MPFTAPQQSKKGFDAGIYEAILYSVIDIGRQETKFGVKHQMTIGWKMIEHCYDDGNPKSFHQTYNVALSPKAKLFELLNGLFIGQNIDWRQTCFSSLLGVGCKLILAPNANGNIKIQSVMPFDLGENKSITEFFSFEDWKESGATALPDFFNGERNAWKADAVKRSLDYREATTNNSVQPDVVVEADDDMPF
jgi:hypothetical protein